jgi:hypothetical protein
MDRPVTLERWNLVRYWVRSLVLTPSTEPNKENNMSDTTITLDADNKVVAAVLTSIRSTLKDGSRYGAYVAEFAVTHDTVKDHAAALAALVTPVTAQRKDGQRTRYGNAVQAAGNGLRTALGKAEGKETDWLKLVRSACENAYIKGEHNTDAIMAAVREALGDDADETPDLSIVA